MKFIVTSRLLPPRECLSLGDIGDIAKAYEYIDAEDLKPTVLRLCTKENSVFVSGSDYLMADAEQISPKTKLPAHKPPCKASLFSRLLQEFKESLASANTQFRTTHAPKIATVCMPRDFTSIGVSTSDLGSFAYSIIVASVDLDNSLLIEPAKLKLFISRILSLYVDNPYHNAHHAVDVLHCAAILVQSVGVRDRFSALEKFALLISAFCHDVGHVGVSNSFLSEHGSELALVYNDQSPLENYHAFLLFFILEYFPDCDFRSHWDQSMHRKFRATSIQCILATDMRHHFSLISQFSNLGASPSDNGLFLCLLIKAADLSNCVRKFDVAKQWGECLKREFYLQGDLERDNCSAPNPSLDRHRDNFPAGQVNFINSFALPLFEVLSRKCPDAEYLLSQLLVNLEEWKGTMNT